MLIIYHLLHTLCFSMSLISKFPYISGISPNANVKILFELKMFSFFFIFNFLNKMFGYIKPKKNKRNRQGRYILMSKIIKIFSKKLVFFFRSNVFFLSKLIFRINRGQNSFKDHAVIYKKMRRYHQYYPKIHYSNNTIYNLCFFFLNAKQNGKLYSSTRTIQNVISGISTFMMCFLYKFKGC